MTRRSLLLAAFWLIGIAVEQWRAEFGSAQGQARVHAAWAVSLLAGRNVADLAKLTDDRDPAVRYWGVAGLLSYARGHDQRVGMALDALLNDKSPAPRIAAAEALCLLGKREKALDVLLASMSDRQESTRIQAVAALEKLGPLPSLEPVLRTGARDSSEYVKRISERALSKFAAAKK
jgi:HEAT repeat protein